MQSDDTLTIYDVIDFVKQHCLGTPQADTISLTNDEFATTITNLPYQQVRRISWLPESLSQLFDIKSTKYLHVGVPDSPHSFIISVLSMLWPSQTAFARMTEEEQINVAHVMMAKLQRETDDAQLFTSNHPVSYIIPFVADYLHINVFVLDIADDELYFGCKEYMSCKKSLFVLRHADSKFEPFYTEQTKCFSVNDKLMTIIRDNADAVQMLSSIVTNDGFCDVIEDITAYMPRAETAPRTRITNEERRARIAPAAFDSRTDDEIDITCNDGELVIDVPAIARTSNNAERPQIKVNQAMTISELQAIASDLGIELKKTVNDKQKNKTKADLIAEIRKYVSNP